MAVQLVQIVNPSNGRKGWVAETSTAAAAYKQPPSSKDKTSPSSESGVKPASRRRRATSTKSGATVAHSKSKED